MSINSRLAQQIEFILELDKLKTVLRKSYLLHGDRRENSAEHSWHVAMAAMILAEHANEPVDVGHVVRLMLVHDIVEIDAGDALVYDGVARAAKAAEERAAAERIFGMLPEEQGARLHRAAARVRRGRQRGSTLRSRARPAFAAASKRAHRRTHLERKRHSQASGARSRMRTWRSAQPRSGTTCGEIEQAAGRGDLAE